jgi:hypothetical protein
MQAKEESCRYTGIDTESWRGKKTELKLKKGLPASLFCPKFIKILEQECILGVFFNWFETLEESNSGDVNDEFAGDVPANRAAERIVQLYWDFSAR